MMKMVTGYKNRRRAVAGRARLRAMQDVERAVLEMVKAGDAVNDESVALRISYSTAQTSRLCVEVLGETARSFATRLRLERAAARLAAGSATTTVVASEAGFLTRESFVRAFGAQFGCAPAEFSRLNRGEAIRLPGYVLATGGTWDRSVQVISRLGLPLTFMFDGPVLLGRVLPCGAVDWDPSFRRRTNTTP
jgi:AraC-like DNA-binding protein